MTYVLDAERHPSVSLRIVPPKGLRKHRVLVKEEDHARFRADPIGGLRELGIHIDAPDGKLPIHELKGLAPPKPPAAAPGDVVDTFCYDIYCCPPFAICFPCKVIEEFTAAVPGWD